MATKSVTTFAQLKGAIEDTTTTQILLASDITFLAGGINVPKTKGDIVIDGAGFTVTDYASASYGDTIYITGSGAAITVTVKNIVWNGRNYYGVVCCVDTSNNANVTVALQNVTYTGPEFIYNRYGVTRVTDCIVRIQKNGSPGNAEELGEVNRIVFAGTVKVTSQTSSTSVMWFPFAGASFTVAENASLQIDAPNTYMWYTDSAAKPVMTFQKNSATVITTKKGLFYSAGTGTHIASSFTVKSGASFQAVVSASNSVPMLKCINSLILEDASTFILISLAAGSSALLYFAETATVTFHNPKSVLLYNNGGAVLSFRTGSTAAPNIVQIDAQLINIWKKATTPYAAAGGFTDVPTAAFFKENYIANVSASIKTTAGAIVSNTNNITVNDAGFPMNASTFPILNAGVLSMGNLDLSVNPITDVSDAIMGTTENTASVQAVTQGATLQGKSDGTGAFRLPIATPIAVDTPVTVSTNWNFLTKSVTVITIGSVSITYLRDIAFYDFAVPYGRSIVRRQNPDWYMEVTDTRKSGGDWYLYASVPTPVQSEAGTLENALTLYQNATQQVLSQTPTLVYTGHFTTPSAVTRIFWPENEGILLTVFPEYRYAAGHYSATILWKIDAPSA